MKLSISNTAFFYINLLRDPEKSIAIQERLIRAGIPANRITRIEGIEKNPSYLGILESQIKALEAGLEKGEPFIVLEDDVELANNTMEVELPDDTDAIYLGLSGWGFVTGKPDLAKLHHIITAEVVGYPHLKRIFNMLSAHAIVYISRHYTSQLIHHLKANLTGEIQQSIEDGSRLLYYKKKILPCDITMANYQPKFKILALKTPVFFQGGEHQYCTLINL